MKILIVGIILALGMVVTGVALAQTQSTLTVGGFTISVPTANPAVLVQSPSRNGTLALKEDIPVTPPASNIIAGQATLVGGTATVSFPAQNAPPICVAIDTTAASAVQRSAVTVSSVTFEGVKNHQLEYVCVAKNN